MEHVAVQDPVAGVIRDEFNFADLSNTDKHVVGGIPCWFWHAASFGPGDPKRHAVQMEWMVVDDTEI